MTTRARRETTQGIPIWCRARDGYWRADFRRNAHVGGGRESLGTKDRTEAEKRVGERLRELARLEKDASLERGGDRRLDEFAKAHLRAKHNEVGSAKTIRNNDRALRYLIDFMRENAKVSDAKLSDVDVAALEAFRDHRLQQVSAATVNQEMAAVSSMLQRAVRQKVVSRNEARHTRSAREVLVEREWLEIHEGVALLEAAADLEGSARSRAYPHLHALLATFLLTGGRRLEVMGLNVQDIDFERRADGHGRVHVRPNEWRGLGTGIKSEPSIRSVPLWPQLRRVLREHLRRTGSTSGLLFPSHLASGMLDDIRHALATAADKAEIAKRVTHHALRHTYTAVRLQTVDAGEAVALYTVARELGHSGTKQIERSYGHVLERRVRLSEVRFESADVIDLASRRRGAKGA